MGWQQWLRGFIKVELPKKFSIKFLNNIKNIKILNLKITKKVIVEDKRTLVLNWRQLSREGKKELSNQLPFIVKDGGAVLEGEFKDRADDYKKQIDAPEKQELIKYFSDKIPLSDISILKASLYLKSLLESGGETRKIKQEIMIRYGNRGKNISNLCSAGYYETWIKPLYEEMRKLPEFSKEKFLEVYNEIVNLYPFAVFIHHGMSSEEVEQIITQKIKASRQYGIKTLNIHGIGEENVAKIRKVVEKIEKEIKLKKRIEEEEGIIVVKLTLSN